MIIREEKEFDMKNGKKYQIIYGGLKITNGEDTKSRSLRRLLHMCHPSL